MAIPGDANLDGDVDVTAANIIAGTQTGDLAIALRNLRTAVGASWATGDFNADGDVDTTQPDALQSNVGDITIVASNLGRNVVPPVPVPLVQLPVTQAPVDQSAELRVATFPQPVLQQSEIEASFAPVAVAKVVLVATEPTLVQPVANASAASSLANVVIEDDVFSEGIEMAPMPLLLADFSVDQSVENQSSKLGENGSPVAASASLVLAGARELRDDAFADDSFASLEITESDIDDLVDSEQSALTEI